MLSEEGSHIVTSQQGIMRDPKTSGLSWCGAECSQHRRIWGAELGAKQEGCWRAAEPQVLSPALPFLPGQGMKTSPTSPLPVFLFTDIPKRIHLPSSCQAISSCFPSRNFTNRWLRQAGIVPVEPAGLGSLSLPADFLRGEVALVWMVVFFLFFFLHCLKINSNLLQKLAFHSHWLGADTFL